MRLSLALVAAGALAAATTSLRADEGLPLPARRASSQPRSPEQDLAALDSQVRVLDQEGNTLEKELHVLKSSGFSGALDGRHDALDELVWDVFTSPMMNRIQRQLAAVESSEAFLKGQAAVDQKKIDDAKAAEEAARAKAAAEAAAAAEQAALSQRIESAISNAKNAWRPDGIVNRNTGDHSWDMWCLALASTAWETALGHSFPPLDADTAYHAYLNCQNAGLIHPGADAPRGALVFWPAGASGDGHVAISNGDGTVVSNYNRNDAPTGINPAAPIENFGAPLGWVDPKDIK